MFDMEMMRECAELYPAEFYGLCVLSIILIIVFSVLVVTIIGAFAEE